MLTSFIAADTETTGLDFEHDRMIELAAVRFENGVPTDTFSALLSPGDRALSPVARLITGITDEELAAAPPHAGTLRAFLAFAGDSPLVAHNAEFDEHFVRRALAGEGLSPLPGVWLDSLLLSRVAWPTWDSHRLDSLAERLQVPRDDEHRALPDARRAGYVFLAAQKHLHDGLSTEGWNALARLSAGLADWSLVFTADRSAGGADRHDAGAENPGPNAGVNAHESGQARQTRAERADLDLIAAASLAEELDALAARLAASADDAWLALETPVGLDETTAALEAARAHLTGAGRGQRVLLAVPDLFAWNLARKNPAHETLRCTALAEPSGYLCRSRLADLIAAPEGLPPSERVNLLPLVAWADRAARADGALGPVADGRGFSPDRARLTWSRVSCDAWSDDASARAARDAAASSDLILVTHATLCAHVRSGGALLPACDTVIVTAAHRFPDVVQSPAGAGRMVSLFRLREILLLEKGEEEKREEISSEAKTPEASAADGAEAAALDPWFAPDRELHRFLQKVGKQAGKHGNDFRVRYTESVASAFGVDAAPLLDALRINEAVSTVAPRTLARLRAFRADLEVLIAAEDAEGVYWVEDGANPHKTTLRSVPRALEGFGAGLRELFGGGLFTSPALLAGGHAARDGRWFLRAAGLQESEGLPAVAVRTLALPKTAAPAAPFFAMAPFAPAPNAGEQMEAYARFLVEIAGPFATQGALVFCPSQTAVRALHHALTGALRAAREADPAREDTPVRAQWIDGNRDAIVRLYASGRGGFVIASEGIPGLRDLEGNAPALWLLTRMPLPPPRDPLLEARGEPLREEGRNVRAELWQPAAVLRLKREWAMLHREGAVAPRALWLLDARAAAEGLGAKLGEALGAHITVARSVEELLAKSAMALNSTAVQQ